MRRTVRRRWFNQYYTLTFDDDLWLLPKEKRIELFRDEYKNHRFRKGEYYDKYLAKLLYKHDLSLDDYRLMGGIRK